MLVACLGLAVGAGIVIMNGYLGVGLAVLLFAMIFAIADRAKLEKEIKK